MKHPLALSWRKFPERYKMQGSYCETCKQVFFPGRQICPKCRRKGSLTSMDMPREGKIYSFTKVHTGPAGFEHQTPYFMALIELSNKAKVLSQIVDSEPEKVRIGAKVKKTLRKIIDPDKKGVISYGYKFKVID